MSPEKGKEGKGNVKVALLATDPRGDDDKGIIVRDDKKSLNRSLVRNRGHKIDEGEGGVATFDSKWRTKY